ncbi:hypothetical protein E1B28_008020 [Marasmius oreades]|uniref:F-box domain-containing protein n=1 Tax=Marasmius oreades TaxID=181124 RepID=A0A9P7S3G8_9AGAR|nr:uncharacterized protein E1B28_008020 [Marasmius oreades]KAG7094420.1 hypothetical protein E1B28_008020 [Marasmius oreades]
MISISLELDDTGITRVPAYLCPKCQDSEFFTPTPTSLPTVIHHLRRNKPPSEDERSEALNALEKEKEELRQLDRALKPLLEWRRSLEKRIRERKSWLTGVRKLPVEILREIFAWVCLSEQHTLSIYKEKEHGSHGKSLETIEMLPINLSHVCYHWRQVVTTSPHLWTSISIHVFNPSRSFSPLLATYLSNSADQPLRIRLYDSEEAYRWAPGHEYREDILGDHGRFIFDTLLHPEHSPRIESLDLDRIDLQVSFNRRPAYYRFSRLRQFYSKSMEVGSAPTAFLRALKYAPLLNTVMLYDICSPNVQLPLCQLTSLTLTVVDSEALFEILPWCSKLRQLVVLEFDFPFPEDSRVLNLPSLRELYILSHRFPEANPSFPAEYLVFPKLTHFQYMVKGEFLPYYSTNWPCPFYHSVVRHCSSSLKQVTIAFHRDSLPSDASRQILQSLPNLTHLDVLLYDDPHSFIVALLSALTIQASHGGDESENLATSEILAPKLTWISIGTVQDPSLYTFGMAECIAGMMISRGREALQAKGLDSAMVSCLSYALFDFVLDQKVKLTEDSVEEQKHFWNYLLCMPLEPGTIVAKRP